MSIFDRVKGALGRGGGGDYIGDLADDSWGEVPMASPSTYLTPEPVRAFEEAPSFLDDDWEVMLRQARTREQREERLIRVPVLEPAPEPVADTDWDAVLAKAKARTEAVRQAPPTPQAFSPLPASPAKASSEPHPAPAASPQPKFAMGTVPPSSARPLPSSAKPATSTAFLPSPRSAARRDDEWDTAIARAKVRAQAGAPDETVDPWEDAIRKAKRLGVA